MQQLKNKIHGEITLGTPSKIVLNSLKKQLKSLQKEIKNMEEALLQNVKEDHQESLTLLKSIPGIGEKTAVELLRHFRSVKRIKTASKKEITEIVGVSRAQKIIDFYNNEEE